MKGSYEYKSYMKIRFTSAIRSLGKHYFLPSFANGVKNDKTSSEIHIIVCLLKTK